MPKLPPVDIYDVANPPDNRNEKFPYAYFHESGAVYRGWGAIARALGVSYGTAKRYHEVFGLPVVRLVGKRVFTTQGSIDSWITKMASMERRLIRKVREEGYGKPHEALRFRVAAMPEEALEEFLEQERVRSHGGEAREGGSGPGGGSPADS